MFAMKETHKQTQTLTSATKQRHGNSGVVHQPMTSSSPFLQRALGNSYLQPMNSVPTIQKECICGGACASCASKEDERSKIQTKLVIGAPNDVYEQEADRVAEQVMQMPGPLEAIDAIRLGKTPAAHVQRLSEDYGEALRQQLVQEEEPYREDPEPRGLSSAVIEEEAVQAKGVPGSSPEPTPTIESAINTMSGSGQHLPDSTRRYMESRFSANFSSIQIHDGSHTAHVAKALHARAFTIGRDIYFGAGEYQPDTVPGRRLLAHELTHVIQQRQASSPSTLQAQRAPLALDTTALLVQRSLADAFNSYTGSCACGEALGNNCAHYLSDALIRSGYADDLDGGNGALYRRRNGFVVCRSGRPVRAAELRDWFAGQATDTVNGEPTEGNRYWAVYQERASDGQGHVLIHSHTGAAYTHRGTGDYPTWRTQNHYGF